MDQTTASATTSAPTKRARVEVASISTIDDAHGLAIREMRKTIDELKESLAKKDAKINELEDSLRMVVEKTNTNMQKLKNSIAKKI